MQYIDTILIRMKLLERIYIIFWKMVMKLIMVDSQHPRTNQLTEVKIPTNQDINRYGHGIEYPIGGHWYVKDTEKNFIE